VSSVSASRFFFFRRTPTRVWSSEPRSELLFADVNQVCVFGRGRAFVDVTTPKPLRSKRFPMTASAREGYNAVLRLFERGFVPHGSCLQWNRHCYGLHAGIRMSPPGWRNYLIPVKSCWRCWCQGIGSWHSSVVSGSSLFILACGRHIAGCLGLVEPGFGVPRPGQGVYRGRIHPDGRPPARRIMPRLLAIQTPAISRKLAELLAMKPSGMTIRSSNSALRSNFAASGRERCSTRECFILDPTGRVTSWNSRRQPSSVSSRLRSSGIFFLFFTRPKAGSPKPRARWNRRQRRTLSRGRMAPSAKTDRCFMARVQINPNPGPGNAAGWFRKDHPRHITIASRRSGSGNSRGRRWPQSQKRKPSVTYRWLRPRFQ